MLLRTAELLCATKLLCAYDASADHTGTGLSPANGNSIGASCGESSALIGIAKLGIAKLGGESSAHFGAKC